MNINELRKLWEQFGDVPVNDDDQIEESFLHFPIGSDKMDIWSWFDEQLPNGIVQNFALCVGD